MDTSPSPLTLADLVGRPVWVGWRTEAPKEGRKPTKVPYNPRSGTKAKSNDARTWATHDEAAEWSATKSGDGVALMFTDIGDTLLAGIDLDTCRNKDTGEITQWAQEVIDRFSTYTEISPSGTGVKLFYTLASDDTKALAALFGGEKKGRAFKNGKGEHPPGIEIYYGLRFFAVTNEAVSGTDELRLVDFADVQWVVREVGPRFAGKPKGGKKGNGHDTSRSGAAWRAAAAVKAAGKSYDEMREALLKHDDPDIAEWAQTKGLDNGERELRRLYDKGGVTGLVRDGSGNPLPILANLMIVLRASPEVADAFTFDEMSCAAVLTQALPATDQGGLGPYPRPVQDADVSQLQEFVQREHLPRIGREVTHQGVDLRARERSFHPIRAYLEGLEWDGEERLDTWMSTYLGAEESFYVEKIGKMMLVAMVARIFEPGCQVDYMPILEGGQGLRKSSACRALAGAEWFSDALPDIHSKDASVHVRGKWLVEIAELSAIGRAESEHLKAFITRREERYRPPYGRIEVRELRQCLYIGTTNATTYLRDETGARRFWPVKVGRIDLGKLRRDRDQLFAEAVLCYQAGDPWWPDEAFEAEHVRPQQDARFETDPWEETIVAHLATCSRVRIIDIARNVLAIDTGKVGTHDQRRIAAVLVKHDWGPIKDHTGRGYVPNKGTVQAEGAEEDEKGP